MLTETVFDRGEHIELMVDRQERMRLNSPTITPYGGKKSPTALKRALWRKNIKLSAIIACIFFVRSPTHYPL